MSRHLSSSLWQRRSALQAMLVSGLGLSLAACGGGSSEPEPPAPQPPAPQPSTADILQAQAQAGVTDGLVGLKVGFVSTQTRSVAAAGKRRQGQGALLEPQDRLAIGSLTKAMTSAAIAGLAERGGPALQMTLSQAFAEGADAIHPAFRQVTLADLLNHRAGLPAFSDLSGEDAAGFLAALRADQSALPSTLRGRRAYFASWLLARPPMPGVVPGRDFLYSNAGYTLAAAAVEARTGRAFEAVFDEMLVQPLALQGVWRSTVPSPSELVQGHEGLPGSLAVVEATAQALAFKDWLDVLGPAMGWSCTGAAYADWLHWHVRAMRGESTPLPRAYVSDLRAAADGRYVWGWQATVTSQRTLLRHFGSVPGFMSQVLLDRAGDFAVFGLSNTRHAAEDISSWILARIDLALREVLRRQSIVL